jgi:hypothetical protein
LLAATLGAACHLAPLTQGGLSGEDAGSASGDDAAEDQVRICGLLVADDAGAGSGSGGEASDAAPAAACTPDENPYAPVGRACASVRDGQPCAAGSLPCDKTCGPAKSGIEVCTCEVNAGAGADAGTWTCPACTYDPTRDYACYRVAAAPPACPPDPDDPNGMLLIRSGDRCKQDWPGCRPCGSHMANAYRDSQSVPRIGFCICTPSCTWSCASVHEWPHACLTDR